MFSNAGGYSSWQYPWLNRLLKNVRPLRRPVRTKLQHGFLPKVESLDERVTPAVTATFSAAAGQLRVIGDAQDNTFVVSRDAAGTILVNNGAVAIQGDRRDRRQHALDHDERRGRQRQPLPERDQRPLAVGEPSSAATATTS